MTMMATQEPTDPSVLLTHTSSSTGSSGGNDNATETIMKPSSDTNTDLINDDDNDVIDSDDTNSDDAERLQSPSAITYPKTKTHEQETSSTNTNDNTISIDDRNAMTPPRTSLANDPNSTPIASIKRPRANLNRKGSSNSITNSSSRRSTTTDMLLSPKASIVATQPYDSTTMLTATPQQRPSGNTTDDLSSPLSPMHKIKPVLHRDSVPDNATNRSEHIKDTVDELFSPVVQFLHDHEEHYNASSDVSHHDSSECNNVVCSNDRKYHNEHGDHYHNEIDDNDDDDDVSMTRPEQPDMNDGEFNPWQFIASLPPYDSVVAYRPSVTLPPLLHPTKKSLVLDLDETLVHCSVTEPTDRKADFTFPVQFHGETYTVHVKCRPFVQEFLQVVSQYFEVIVFTASQRVYADALLNILDPDGRCIHHRLFRESCLAVEGNYLKDLNVLGRDLHRTVLVDNSPHAFGYQVDNGIPIESWFDDMQDRELIKLQRFLLNHILPSSDVRKPIQTKFQSHILIANAPPFLH